MAKTKTPDTDAVNEASGVEGPDIPDYIPTPEEAAAERQPEAPLGDPPVILPAEVAISNYQKHLCPACARKGYKIVGAIAGNNVHVCHTCGTYYIPGIQGESYGESGTFASVDDL